MSPGPGSSTGNRVHRYRKVCNYESFGETECILTSSVLQNSGPVPTRFLGTDYRQFSGRSSTRDALVTVFQIRGIFTTEILILRR
jgi:hypothetical protein